MFCSDRPECRGRVSCLTSVCAHGTSSAATAEPPLDMEIADSSVDVPSVRRSMCRGSARQTGLLLLRRPQPSTLLPERAAPGITLQVAMSNRLPINQDNQQISADDLYPLPDGTRLLNRVSASCVLLDQDRLPHGRGYMDTGAVQKNCLQNPATD